ncbi:unnamed protein product, partial [Brassica oleracea]
KNAGAEHNFSKSDPLNEDLLSNMDGYYDLEFDSSSQESFDSDTSDHKQFILLEPEINNQSERVMKLAVMFKKTFSERFELKQNMNIIIMFCTKRNTVCYPVKPIQNQINFNNTQNNNHPN